MSDTSSHKARPHLLAGLMKMTGDEPTKWPPAELGAILRHQLSVPLENDLRTIVVLGEPTLSQMSALKADPRPGSFGDLIGHPSPPLDLLNIMKDFARNGRDSGSLPPEVGTVLYYAAIMLGILRHQTRITKLDDQSLRKGVEWAAALPWIDDRLRQIFTEGLEKLAK